MLTASKRAKDVLICLLERSETHVSNLGDTGPNVVYLEKCTVKPGDVSETARESPRTYLRLCSEGGTSASDIPEWR